MRSWRLILGMLLLAGTARAAPFMVVPIYPSAETDASITPALAMACGRFIMPTTIIGATKMAVNITIGFGAGKKVGVAIYPDSNGGSAIANSGSLSGGATPPETAGVLTVISLPAFDMTAGITYRVCFCGTSTTGAYAAPNWASFADLQNAIVASVGRAANDCD